MVSGGVKTIAIRLVTVLLLVALTVQLSSGWMAVAGWLRTNVLQGSPGVLAVSTRPDLNGPGPQTDSYSPPKGRFDPYHFEFAGQSRQFFALPAVIETGLPPLVILLHGSGRVGRAMLDMWSEIAAKGVFLLAPDALGAGQWSAATDGPDFLSAFVEQAYGIQAFDRESTYLYGHSAGASMALSGYLHRFSGPCHCRSCRGAAGLSDTVALSSSPVCPKGLTRPCHPLPSRPKPGHLRPNQNPKGHPCKTPPLSLPIP